MLQQVRYTYFAFTKKLQTCYFSDLDTKDTHTCKHINNKHIDLLYLDGKQKSQNKMGKNSIGKRWIILSTFFMFLKKKHFHDQNTIKMKIAVQLTST